MLLNDIKRHLLFSWIHTYIQHKGTLTERKILQKWNSFAHLMPSSHLLPMVRQLQSNEMWDFALQLRLCGCFTFQETHREYDTVRGILPGHSLYARTFSDRMWSHAGVRVVQQLEQALLLCTVLGKLNNSLPINSSSREQFIITRRSESFKERQSQAERRAVCSLAHVTWLTVPLFEHSVGVYRKGGQAGTDDPSTCNNAFRNACSFFFSPFLIQ